MPGIFKIGMAGLLLAVWGCTSAMSKPPFLRNTAVVRTPGVSHDRYQEVPAALPIIEPPHAYAFSNPKTAELVFWYHRVAQVAMHGGRMKALVGQSEYPVMSLERYFEDCRCHQAAEDFREGIEKIVDRYSKSQMTYRSVEMVDIVAGTVAKPLLDWRKKSWHQYLKKSVDRFNRCLAARLGVQGER